ncbi:MAG: PA0069 family radical SAM protein [Pseudomonadota bacterium]
MSKASDLIVSDRILRKGRGALSNHRSRYQPTTTSWQDGIEHSSPDTQCRATDVKSIITRNTSPDIPFTQSINPYQGCEHGCIYCYARPTHAYHDLSPGIDFETQLTYKRNAAQQLQRELAKPDYKCSIIALGANTDPYQPVEKTLQITRQILEVLHKQRHPVSIITKGALIRRDIDLLAEMAVLGLCSVAISVTTLDDGLKRVLEPRASSGHTRLQLIEELSNAGIPVTVLVAPVIPALNDKEMETILASAKEAGAQAASYILLRLPLEIRDLFVEWLKVHFPLRAEHVMSLVRQSRGGADYDSRFRHRMRGTGPFAAVLAQRFASACKRLGLNAGEARYNTRTDLFNAPAMPATLPAADRGQLLLF